MSNSEDNNDAVQHMMDGGNVGESEVVHRSSNDDAMDAEMDDNNNNDEPSNDDDDDESMDSNDSEGRNWDPYGFYEEAFDMLKSNDREAVLSNWIVGKMNNWIFCNPLIGKKKAVSFVTIPV